MKKLFLVMVVFLAAIGAWYYDKHHPVKETPLTLYGNVDIREVNLGFRVSGRLARLFYDEGDLVKAGEVIAQLDDEPYRNQVAAVAAQVSSVKERLKLRETGNRPQEIAQVRSLVREREIVAANAKRQSQRAEKSLAIQGISTQERDNTEAAYREAEARLASARQNLALLEAGSRIEDIAQAQADLAQVEASLVSAQLQVQDAVLKAPSDGVVLTRAQEIGAILPVGATVFTLSLQTPVWVRAYVHEPELGHIHPGTSVKLYTDSRQEQAYIGKVGFISPRAEFTPKTVETPALRSALVYRLRIVVANPDEALRQGMPVTIRLTEDGS